MHQRSGIEMSQVAGQIGDAWGVIARHSWSLNLRTEENMHEKQ